MVEAKTAETRESLGTTSTDALPVGVSCTPESEPAKSRRGRPKGVPNKVNRIAKEAIAEAEPHTFLIKVMSGLKFVRAGTDGAKRKVDCFPTLQQSIEAAYTLLRKTAPDMKATEITGAEGGPIRTSAETKLSTLELARQTAYLLDLAGRESQTEGALRSTPAPPNSTPCAPEPHAGHTPPENLEKNSARNPDEARSPDSRFGATALDGSCLAPSAAPASTLPAESSVFSDVYGHISGPRKTLPNGPDEPAPRTEPEVGAHATIGDFIVEVQPPSREGLPLQYAIKNSRGGFVTMAPGWAAALEWVKKKSPDGADLSVRITKPRPLGGGSRPDERAARSTWTPAVHGSYPNRKS